MNIISKIIAATLISLSLATPALADYTKGNEAFKARDYATAKMEFEALPEDAAALYKLGLIYMNGMGIEPDQKLGRGFVKKSADLGYTGAQMSMGRAYQNGIGIDKNLVQAYYYFRLAGKYSSSSQKSADELELLLTPEQLAQADQLLAKAK